MAPWLALLLLATLRSAALPPSARTSFPINSAERPLVHFSLPDIHSTTTLLLSDDGSTLYMGAQDAIISLDVSQRDIITLKKKVQWRPPESDIDVCQRKGKNATVDCPNFISVLQQINSTHLYACGSFAYSPRDAFIDTQTFSLSQQKEAKGRCPFNPTQRNTAIIIDGELFTATTTDFRGVEPQIARHFSKDGRPDISQHSGSLLDEPTFVSWSWDAANRKLFFFFSEVGKEFSFVDKLQIARVAQICKDDVGGQRTLQRKWTSFAKASLLCQFPNQLPFNIVQDMFTLLPPEGNNTTDTLFYGIFTSQGSLGRDSAVCVFKLQDVRDVFTASYRTFNKETHQWSTLLGKHSYLGQCGLDTASDNELEEVKRSFLTSRSVTPLGGSPILVSSQQRYSRVAAMRTEGTNRQQYDILFLLSESGFLHKVVLTDRGAQVIEEIQVFTQPQLIKNIVLSPSKGLLYVGTSHGVTAVPVANCGIYRSCLQCILARDPLCGWNRSRKLCSGLNGGHDMVQVLDNSNVEEECRGQALSSTPILVNTQLNQAVTLPCQKPSNLARLTWTSSQFSVLPQKLFIQSDGNSLNFFATTNTFGMYHCEAEEGGHKEVMVSYNVQHIASPHSMAHPSMSAGDQEPADELASTNRPAGDVDVIQTKNGKFILPECETDTHGNTTSKRDCLKELLFVKERSYYSELVVVSLMLAVCICMLMLVGFRVWQQQKTNSELTCLFSQRAAEQGEGTHCLHSSPKDGDPEVKVVV
ncbi:semaphorin-4A [Aulostomus maculatus]